VTQLVKKFSAFIKPKNQPLNSILRHVNPVRTFMTYFSKIHLDVKIVIFMTVLHTENGGSCLLRHWIWR